MKKTSTESADSQPKHVPELKRDRYGDGHPLDELQARIILKGDRFDSIDTFR
jgi:hypothetical protein